MTNNEEFENFWKTYVWPEQKPVVYKLYYNDTGDPIAYTTEDLNGKYIELTAEQYQASDPKVKVRNGVLIKLSHNQYQKLKPTNIGTACDPSNVAVVVNDNQPHVKWTKQTYDNN